MNILYIKGEAHPKNYHFIKLCKIIHFTEIFIEDLDNYNLNDYDCVLSLSLAIDVIKYQEKYKHIKFIFGPQFSVFPNDSLNIIKGNNVFYNILSNWVKDIWSTFEETNNLNLITLPFGVDVNRFNQIKPIKERTEIILYFKRRSPFYINFISQFLNNKNIKTTYFDYNRRYKEEDYLNSLQNAKYAIIIDAHESQGFALQEAMSCNVPLLVWNCKTMNDEYGSGYPLYKASSIPYWDNRCGEFFYNEEELEEVYNKFINNIENYRPREFILENLSIDACENNWIKFIKS